MASEPKQDGADTSGEKNKAKRTRTGCWTCRDRHLKCDEGLPECQNCRKSNRGCKYGMKAQFNSPQVHNPDVLVEPSEGWHVHFQDDSREVASEYKGGLDRYPVETSASTATFNFQNGNTQQTASAAPAMGHHQLPPMQTASYPESAATLSPGTLEANTPADPRNSMSHDASPFNGVAQQQQTQTFANSEPNPDAKQYLNQSEETLFMQVFVEEVGLWMDSMDPMKHFSRLLPFHSLGEPMLLNSFLACGARHLTLVNPIYKEDKALKYYDIATRVLLNTLQNPNRDTALCATTAVILNVYEIMSERALQRMNHIAGARALIKECGWNARSTGIGAACFWLNVGMELLSCLHFNWQVAWDPDDWGVDMDFTTYIEPGREEVWTHRIVYITGKIANFRASAPHFSDVSQPDQQMRLQNRYNEWKRLRNLCDSWNHSVPRTMQPMSYLHSYQTSSKSAFPEVWLIKRTTIVARLFYHTAMCLLAQICPIMTTDHEDIREMQILHSRQICGIVAHVKDRGVASVALRSLAIAAESLVVRREQEEVLAIFERINKETGWRVGFLNKELKEKWGWNNEAYAQQQAQSATGVSYTNGNFQQQQQQHQQQQQQQQQQQHFANNNPPPMPVQPPRRPGMSNPLMTADFSSQHPPYEAYWVAPNQQTHHSNFFSM